MKKGMTNRQKQAIKTEAKIYNTAIILMEKHGFDHITVEDICKKANVSVGSFYHYFKSKSDILIEIYNKADEYFELTVLHNLNKDNSIDQIVLYFQYYAKYNMISGLDTLKQLYSTNNIQFARKGRYLQTLLKQLIEAGQQNSELTSACSADYMVEFLFICMRGLVYDWCIHEGGYDLEEKTKEYAERLMEAFQN